METITMWAELSSEATNAQRRAVPDTHVLNAILSTDAAKIRKNAEEAIHRDKESRVHRIYYGCGAEMVIAMIVTELLSCSEFVVTDESKRVDYFR